MKKTTTLFLLLMLLLSGCRLPFARQPSPPPAPTATEGPPRPETPGSLEPLADGGVRLSTGDGLTLELDAEGRVSGLWLDEVALPVTADYPLTLRDLTDAAQMAEGELDLDGWEVFLQNHAEVQLTASTARRGVQMLVIEALDGNAQGAAISPPLPVQPGTRYRVSARFKVEFGYVDESGNPTFWQDSVYSGERLISGLYLLWLDADGRPLEAAPQLAAPLHWNASDWRQLTREVTAPPGAAAVRLIAGAKPVSGAVWVEAPSFLPSPETDAPLVGGLEILDDRVVQRGRLNGLEVSLTYRPLNDHLAIQVEVHDPDGNPHALDVAWGLPLKAQGWRWWDDLRTSRPLGEATDYANAVSADITGYLPVSRYPYTLLEDGTHGLTLAQPLDGPRYLLLHYDGLRQRLEARAHLGLSPLAVKLDNSADFSLQLYRVEAAPTWGLRAAAEKHVRLNPAGYRRDSRDDFAAYQDYVREHFSASGAGAESLRAYNEAGVYAAQYTVFEMPLAMQEKTAPPPSYQEARAALEALADNADPVRAAYPVSAVCDGTGEPHLKSIAVHPWSQGRWSVIWPANVDPDLPGGYGQAKLDELAALFAETQQAGLTLNGVFIDNFISTSLVDLCPEHLAAADLPLTYDPNTYQPGVHTASAGWEFLQALRALLDEQPSPYRSLSVNFWALNLPTQLGAWIDAFGGEGASAEGSNWTPEILDYRMATAMQRPRLFANQQSDLSLAEVDAFLETALFYGVWPSQGPNAAGWPAAAAGRVEAVRLQVRPLIVAGWQPLPYAVSDQPTVWVERFGGRTFTLYNAGEQEVAFTLTIDLAALGLSAGDWRLLDVRAGRPLEGVSRQGDALIATAQLGPGETAVYLLEEEE